MKWMIVLLGLSAPAAAGEPQANAFGDGGNPATLRAALCDLIDHFGSRYPSGEEFLRRLDAIDQQMASDSDAARAAFEQLQRAALIANPLVQTQPILFVVREQYLPDHHNTETIFHTGEPNNRSYRPGGPLKILDPVTGRTSVLLESVIRAGHDQLRSTPEADMPGFRPCEEHQVRETKYQALREREQKRRQALSDGRKIFDPEIGVER